MPERQDDDRGHENGRHRVVEDHQPYASLAVEQRAGNGTQSKPRNDREQDGQAREAGRLVALQDEQHQDDLPHLPAETCQERPQHHASEARHAEQRGIRRLDRSRYGS